MTSIRQERVAELIKRELSMVFQRQANAWFDGMFITVTQVRIGPDLGLARVYLSFMAVKDKDEALGHDVMFISAKTKVGYDEFRRAMYDRVKDLHIKRYPYNHFLY